MDIKQAQFEFIGTFIFITCIFNITKDRTVYREMTLPLIGLSLIAAVLFISNGPGMLNPAVAVAMYLNKSISFNTCITYSAAEILGGIEAWYYFSNFGKV